MRNKIQPSIPVIKKNDHIPHFFPVSLVPFDCINTMEFP